MSSTIRKMPQHVKNSFHGDGSLVQVYLEELNVVISERQLLQLLLSPPQIPDLRLDSLHQSFSSGHGSFLLISDHLPHSRTPPLGHRDDLSVGLLVLIKSCIFRALTGRTEGLS